MCSMYVFQSISVSAKYQLHVLSRLGKYGHGIFSIITPLSAASATSNIGYIHPVCFGFVAIPIPWLMRSILKSIYVGDGCRRG